MRFDFVLDDAYFVAFHEEMVATRLPRWRWHRRVAVASLGSAVAMLGWTLLSARADTLALALVFALVGGGMTWRLRRRRDRWLAFQRELPTYGAHVAVEVRDGQLVQTSDRVPDVLGIRRGEILESPRGWFVTYDIVHMGTQPTDRAVNTRKASAWLPADAMSPPAPRDAFAAAVASAFRVVRR